MEEWLRRLIPTIFMLYPTLLKLNHPVSSRQAPVATRVDISEQEVLRMLQHRGGTLVAWVDQFKKARYSKNLATRRDVSLSTTAMALIRVGSFRGHFAEHPMPDSLYSDVAEHVMDLQDAWLSFTAATKHLVRQHMGFEEVRCPLDLHRKDVEVAPWYTLAIRDVPTSATFGFHQAIYGVL